MTEFTMKKNLDPNKRVKYTQGLVMGVDEFEQEQRYFIEKNRLHNRGLHGYGTVCGLNVKIELKTQGKGPQVVVSPGIAINPAGQEIHVPIAQCADLENWVKVHDNDIQDRIGTSPNTISAYVVLCYRECETDNVAIPGIPCRSQEDSIASSRITDDFELSICLPPKVQKGETGEISSTGEEQKFDPCANVVKSMVSEEEAVRRFSELLGRVVITDQEENEENLTEDLGDHVRGLDKEVPDALYLHPDRASEIIRAALRVWVTEVRPGTMGEDSTCAVCSKDAACSCVHLARLEFPVKEKNISPEYVTLIEDERPLLLPSRVLQELLPYYKLGKTAENNSNLKHYKGNCMLNAIPQEGWDAVFDRIADNQDVSICFQAGTYKLDKPMVLKNKGHIKISGSGAGTQFIGLKSEIVFKFESCKSVLIEDIYAESGVSGSGQNEHSINLNGTLTFCACPKVIIERVALKCAAGAERARSCINVRNAVKYLRQTNPEVHPVESVQIHNCDLKIGRQQAGILLVNVLRTHVKNNMLQVHEISDSLPVLLENKKYRSAIRSLMIYSPLLGQPQNNVINSSDIVDLEAGEGFVRFRTDPLLVSAWKKWIESNPPRGVKNDRDLLFRLKKDADRILLNEGVLKVGETEFTMFRNWYNLLINDNPVAGLQGIVIGGSKIEEVHIIDNKISGFLQGIHVGTSHRGVTSSTVDIAKIVHLTGNNIRILFSPAGTRERHGIFAGNCDSLIVQDNYVFVERSSLTEKLGIDGIRIYGHPGRMMIVRQNHMVNASTGVYFVGLSGGNGNTQWVITDNMAEKCNDEVKMEGTKEFIQQKVRGIEFNFS